MLVIERRFRSAAALVLLVAAPAALAGCTAARECERYGKLADQGVITPAERDRMNDSCQTSAISVKAAQARANRRAFVPDAQSLAARTGLSEQRAGALMPLLAGPDVPFDTPSRDGGPTLADSFAHDARSPEEEVCLADERACLRTALRTALAELSPREQQILKRRVMADAPETLEQLGVSFGVSRERVRQIEERTKARVRARLASLTGESMHP